MLQFYSRELKTTLSTSILLIVYGQDRAIAYDIGPYDIGPYDMGPYDIGPYYMGPSKSRGQNEIPFFTELITRVTEPTSIILP